MVKNIYKKGENRMKIFIVNGKPGSGKTTFEELCSELYGYCNILSSINVVKSIAFSVGWDGEKTPKNRKFLSDLKDLLTEWNDVPFNDIIDNVGTISKLPNENKRVIFIDCREPKEIERFKQKLSAKTLLIRRDTKENKEASNHADAEVENYKYDIVIDNNGSKGELIDKVVKFIKEELY